MDKIALMHNCVSVLQSLVFVGICVAVPPAIQSLNMRPIPLQELTFNGETVYVKDLELTNPYIPDSEVAVSGFELALVSFAFPVGFFLVVWLLGSCLGRLRRGSKEEEEGLVELEEGKGKGVGGGSEGGAEFALIMSSYFYAMGTTLLVTDWAKLYVGRLRPNFYSICGYNDDTRKCEGEESLQNEGRSSFPSGHSSLSMCGCLMVSLYLTHKLSRPKAPSSSPHSDSDSCNLHSSPLAGFFAGLFPVLLAVFVACSRVHDNWHHPSDVLAGAAVGGISAFVCFRYFYAKKVSLGYEREPTCCTITKVILGSGHGCEVCL